MDIVLGTTLSRAALTAALRGYFPGASVLVVEDLDEIAHHRAEVYACMVHAAVPSDFPVGLDIYTGLLGGHADVELMILDLARHLSETLRCPVISTAVGAVKVPPEAPLSVLWRGGEAFLASLGPDLDALEPIVLRRTLDLEELGL